MSMIEQNSFVVSVDTMYNNEMLRIAFKSCKSESVLGTKHVIMSKLA